MGAFEFVPLGGDSDCDADLDLADFVTFVDCFTGPDGSAQPQCRPFDTDMDDDVDLADLVAFQAAFTGSR